MTDTKPRFRKIAVKAARLADSKKAEDIALYALAGRSALADYALAASVDSVAHLEAVDDEISGKLKKEGVYPLHRDGANSKNWKVLDYGGLIIHIIERQARARYSLDEIFNGFKQVRWQPPAPSPEKIKKPAGKKASRAAKIASRIKSRNKK